MHACREAGAASRVHDGTCDCAGARMSAYCMHACMCARTAHARTRAPCVRRSGRHNVMQARHWLASAMRHMQLRAIRACARSCSLAGRVTGRRRTCNIITAVVRYKVTVHARCRCMQGGQAIYKGGGRKKRRGGPLPEQQDCRPGGSACLLACLPARKQGRTSDGKRAGPRSVSVNSTKGWGPGFMHAGRQTHARAWVRTHTAVHVILMQDSRNWLVA